MVCVALQVTLSVVVHVFGAVRVAEHRCGSGCGFWRDCVNRVDRRHALVQLRKFVPSMAFAATSEWPAHYTASRGSLGTAAYTIAAGAGCAVIAGSTHRATIFCFDAPAIFAVLGETLARRPTASSIWL